MVPARDIDKFNTSPFFERIYDNGNVVIYRYSSRLIPTLVEHVHKRVPKLSTLKPIVRPGARRSLQ